VIQRDTRRQAQKRKRKPMREGLNTAGAPKKKAKSRKLGGTDSSRRRSTGKNKEERLRLRTDAPDKNWKT